MTTRRKLDLAFDQQVMEALKEGCQRLETQLLDSALRGLADGASDPRDSLSTKVEAAVAPHAPQLPPMNPFDAFLLLQRQRECSPAPNDGPRTRPPDHGAGHRPAGENHVLSETVAAGRVMGDGDVRCGGFVETGLRPQQSLEQVSAPPESGGSLWPANYVVVGRRGRMIVEGENSKPPIKRQAG
jgi:hypothetical protein